MVLKDPISVSFGIASSSENVKVCPILHADSSQIIILPSPREYLIDTTFGDIFHLVFDIAEMKSGFICKEDLSPMVLCPLMMLLSPLILLLSIWV